MHVVIPLVKTVQIKGHKICLVDKYGKLSLSYPCYPTACHIFSSFFQMASRSSRSAHSGKAFSANRTVITPAKMSGAGQKYPEIKQRGFYSDIIASSAVNGELGVCVLSQLSY